MTKKLVSLLCVFALCLSFALPVSASGVTVEVDAVDAQQGTVVSVPIRISGNTGLAGAQFSLSYANGLRIEEIVPGNALSSLEFTPPGDLTANPVTLMWDGKDDDATNGVLATLKFNVANLTPGEYPISITPVTSGIYDNSLTDVPVSITNGKIVVIETGTSGGGGTDEDGPNIKIVDAKGKSGKTVDVVIEIKNNPGIAYLSFDLGYDGSVMTLQSVTGNDVFDTADFIAGDLEKNPYTVLAANYTGDKTANGRFVTATFLIKEDCAEGTYEITVTNPQAYNIDEAEKTFSATNGIVTVKNIDAGDVTGDGKINGMDLLRLGKYFAGWTVEIDETGADVTGDGKINGMDLLRLGKYFAGWEVKLGK